MIKAFNKRFPEIKVEMVRAPGGQLITRIKTEAAAGKLAADVIDHSDRALMKDLVGLFQDHAAERRRLSARGDDLAQAVAARHPGVVDRLQCRAGEEAAEELRPHQSGIRQQADRPGDRAVGGTTWTRDVRAPGPASRTIGRGRRRPTRRSIPPAPKVEPLVRGDIQMGPLLYNIVYTKKRTAHRWRFSSRPRARRSTPMPGCADDGKESERRQAVPQLVPVPGRPDLHDQGAGQSHLAQAGAGLSAGLRSQGGQGLAAELRPVRPLHAAWVEEWNKTYGYHSCTRRCWTR